ncbi:MAG: diaminopimelate decarboxylase [Gammaproteobacteria bacterium]
MSRYRGGILCVDGVALTEIAARYGTPCYVYSRAGIERAYREYDQALAPHPHLVCYAVKANSNLAVLDVLARLGAGFDIVSVGELERVLRAGGVPGRVMFAGVGKRADEMQRALEVGIRCFNVESWAEIEGLNRIAGGLGLRAPVSIRVNPDVEAGTHPYVTTGERSNKFGIGYADALDVCRRAAALAHVKLLGIGCHVGSQLTALEPILSALRRVLALADALAAEGLGITQVDIGGGLGIRYHRESPPSTAEYGRALVERLAGRAEQLIIEPGRSIAGPHGLLLTRVEYLKTAGERRYAVVDAAMNDLLRPALYGAWQDIVPVDRGRDREAAVYDVVGPVCESADCLGQDRPLAIAAGDLLAVCDAGAYGFSMSSTYNSRPRAAEVMVSDNQARLVRRRETVEELLAGEAMLG